MERRLISQTQFAGERGVSKAYISRLVKLGKISLVDGKIDADDAAQRLDATQDVVKRASKLIRFPSGLTPQVSADVEPQTVQANEVVDAKDLPDQLLRARVDKEREDARIRKLDRQAKEGKLVDAEEVHEAQLRRATEEREAWLNWPPRNAALMAAELEIEELRLLPVLRKYVRQHLAERSKQ